MSEQHQIQRRLSKPDSVERVRRLAAANPNLLRTKLADLVCDEFGFVDRRQQRQRSGCLKALLVLAKRGLLTLPAATTKPGPSRPRRLDSSVPEPQGVPGHVDDIRTLELVVVEDEEGMRVWNTLMIEEHPLGAGPLVGRQLRYLIKSEHGWLGGMGFAAAALHLRARDRWIGWDFETRQKHLDRVVGMSRFLVRPAVHCKNLASRVLGLAMRWLRKDFEARYGYEPWVIETFVDPRHYSGTCYRAANWIRVGSTQGRGRQDREVAKAKGVKDIYVYVLAEGFREQLGLPADAGLGPLPLDKDLDAANWTEREFGGAPLGDKRLSQRLVRSASVQAEKPMDSFSNAAKGDRSLLKGHYRLLDEPDDSAVNMENILTAYANTWRNRRDR